MRFAHFSHNIDLSVWNRRLAPVPHTQIHQASACSRDGNQPRSEKNTYSISRCLLPYSTGVKTMDDTNKKTHFVYRKGEQIGPYEIVQALDQTGFQDIYLG